MGNGKTREKKKKNSPFRSLREASEVREEIKERGDGHVRGELERIPCGTLPLNLYAQSVN